MLKEKVAEACLLILFLENCYYNTTIITLLYYFTTNIVLQELFFFLFGYRAEIGWIGFLFFFVQDLITFQFSLKQISRELIIRIIYNFHPHDCLCCWVVYIHFTAQCYIVYFITLSKAVSSWLYSECAAPRGPTYPRCPGRINMLLDMTRVQCSASGVFLITVAASRCLGHLFWWVLPVVVIFPLYLYKTIPTYFLA